MEINFEDYLSDTEIHDIVEEEFRNAIKRRIERTGIDVWIINMGYKNVFKMIDNEIPDFEILLKDKVKNIIDNLTSYSVFVERDDFLQKEDSLGQKYLNESVENNKQLINQKVVDIINELKQQDIASDIMYIIEEKIDNMFNNKGGD